MKVVADGSPRPAVVMSHSRRGDALRRDAGKIDEPPAAALTNRPDCAAWSIFAALGRSGTSRWLESRDDAVRSALARARLRHLATDFVGGSH